MLVFLGHSNGFADIDRTKGIAMHASKSLVAHALVSLFGLIGLFAAGPAQAAGPDFEREIQPLLAEHCAHCHGIDESTRQGGLRLDIRQNALEGGDSGQPAIVPGKPDE